MATMEELADKVAHATTGKEVRGAIAEGFGQFDQVKGEVFRRVKAVEDDNAALNQRVDKLDDDLSAEAQTRAEADKELNSKIDKLNSDKVGNTDFDAKLSEFNEDWKDRLRRVTLGTDEETIENVVTKILIEKGVI